jgi:hypothetical protein
MMKWIYSQVSVQCVVVCNSRSGEVRYIDIYEVNTRKKAEPQRSEKQLTNCVNQLAL